MTRSGSVVVDTMVVSALVNAGRDSDASARYRAIIDGRSIVVSFVTVTEMRFGAIRAGWGEIRRRHLERVLARLVVVQPDDDLMLMCAELRATCLASGMQLVRRSTMPIAGSQLPPWPLRGAHFGDALFENVPGLVVQSRRD